MQNLGYVGFWKRVIIYLIDFVIYFVCTLLIGLFTYYITKLLDKPIVSNSDVEYLVFFVFRMILPLIFLFFLWKLKGGSIGMLIFKVRIIDVETTKKPTGKKLLIRLLGAISSHFTFLLSFLHVVFDSRKQTWHDKMSGTILMKQKKDLDDNNQFFPKSTNRDKNFLRFEIPLFSVLMIVMIIFLFFIFHDDKLIPEAKEWMQRVEFTEEHPMDNEFYFLIGLSSLENFNPIEVGYNWVQTENDMIIEKIKKNDLDHSSDLIVPFTDDSLKVNLSKLSAKYEPLDSLYVTTFLSEKGNFIDSVFCSLDFLFNRYERIGTFSYFHNTQIPHFSANNPYFSDLILINRLKAYWIIKEFLSGNEIGAIKELNKMNTKARYLMRISETQIEKMVSWFMLENNLLCLSFMIDASENFNFSNIALSPLTKEEMNWDKIIKGYFKEQISDDLIMYNKLNAKSNYVVQNFFVQLYLKWVFKLNKSINSSYEYCLNLNKFSNLNGNDFKKLSEEIIDEEFNFRKFIFEPTSYMMNSSNLSFEISYLTHNHDINGYINMLKLKMMIKEQNLTSEQIPQFLEAQSDSLFNPYSEETIKWDAENSKIFFKGPYDYNDKNMREIKVGL